MIQALIGPATKLLGKFIEDKDTKNKNGRLSFDNIPLSNFDDSVLELFKKDLVDLYDLKEPLLREGLIDYAVQSQ